MSSQRRSHFVQPKIALPRPPLPVEHTNPYIRHIDPNRPPPVKFQEIVRDGHATVVGRIKIQTPGGHAFILRRLDTGAVSLTTMFRAAFPTAPEEAEKAETSWVKMTYDTSGANKSGKARFAGTWVNPEIALSLSEGYSLSALIRPLSTATPDPDAIHRKKHQQPSTPATSPFAQGVHGTPMDGPGPTKRRREASPVATTTTPASAKQFPSVFGRSMPPPPAPSYATDSTPSRIPVASRQPASPVRQAAIPATPTSLRRSTRLKSPPAPTQSSILVQQTLTGSAGTKHEVSTPGGSDETAVEDESFSVAKATEVNMHDDIREQRELIERLKAERAAKAKAIETQAAQEDGEIGREGGEGLEEEITLVDFTAGGAKGQKRGREDEEQLRFEFREKEKEKEARAIATNRRIKKAERKQLAWGTLAFAFGLGAVSFLPNLPSFF